MSSSIKIVVAEPSLIIRNGILAVLKRLNLLHVDVLEINDMEHLKNVLTRQKPDILIVNPASLGMLSLQQLRKDLENPQLKFVALQMNLTDAITVKMYDEVISIYDTADRISETLAHLIIQESEMDKRQESLSIREKEVIVCVIQGMTNRQIADRLCLSTHTVTTHRRNISTKLQIHSIAGLAIYAIVNKLVSLNDLKDVNIDGEDIIHDQ
ncbi:MAG: LuxR C-terminal-related transcriptional regulator [Bacteroidales bacterium]|jgi:DNA-binding NarL/FixJ family response regulator|nr:LuxR C-terminal-related transcriptional regulator [Bacteroidales bacterium]